MLARSDWHPPDANNPLWHRGITLFEQLAMPLFRTAQAEAGARGANASLKLRSVTGAALVAAGYAFVVRYVGFDARSADDLDLDELRALTSAGLAVMVVQHPRTTDWSERSGNADGRNAVTFARLAA